MTFEEMLDQALAMLQRRGRVATYRALKLQFSLTTTTWKRSRTKFSTHTPTWSMTTAVA